MMTSPDAVPGQEKLIADSGHSPDEYPDTVAARIALHIGFYSRWAGCGPARGG